MAHSEAKSNGSMTDRSPQANKRSSDSSNMEILLRMGFPNDRAEKALTCTGDVSVPAAIDWILSHTDDPFLDAHDQREYLIYLCPSGLLLEGIHEFLRKTCEIAGRNGAHLHMPHITMCHAFKTDAGNVPTILRVMEEAITSMVTRLPTTVKLDRYTSESFMGLFLDKETEKVLKQFSRALVTSLQDLSSKPIPFNSDKAFHLTLAYHFEPSQYEAIHSLSKQIPLKAPCQWQFLLLSRDARFHSHEVYEMKHPWGSSSNPEGELPYRAGDYVYIAPKPAETHGDKKSAWVPAVSWSTGSSGMVPLTGVEKTFASDVWILHGCIPYGAQKVKKLLAGQTDDPLSLSPDVYPLAQRSRWVLMNHGQAKKAPAFADIFAQKLNKYNVKPEVPWLSETAAAGSEKAVTNGGGVEPAVAYVMRHGERMDFVFGVDWIHRCFDQTGNFTRTDLNMPKTVPKRRAGPSAYIRDPPLTAMGVLQAQLTGRAMKEAGVVFSHVYVSPALRSIQTAAGVLDAYKEDSQKPPKICVEPGLYEWFGWVREAHPDWLTTAELHAFGIPVDLEYHAHFARHQLDFNEDVEGFYNRNGLVLRKVMEQHRHTGGNVLFVAHASSLDTCTRQLTGAPPRAHFEMNRITQRVPYCAVVTCVSGPEQTWTLKNPPFPTLTHGANIKFNAVQTFVNLDSFDDERPLNGTAQQKLATPYSPLGSKRK